MIKAGKTSEHSSREFPFKCVFTWVLFCLTFWSQSSWMIGLSERTNRHELSRGYVIVYAHNPDNNLVLLTPCTRWHWVEVCCFGRGNTLSNRALPLFLSERWGWLLTALGSPCVAQRVWAMPKWVSNTSSRSSESFSICTTPKWQSMNCAMYTAQRL